MPLQVTGAPEWEPILRRDAEAWFAGGEGLDGMLIELWLVFWAWFKPV